MTSEQTPRLRLNIPTVNTIFSLDDLSDNWEALDDHPGVYLCTSTTRPDWGADNAGQLIFEGDTGLHWVFDGTVFARVFPLGLLGQTRVTTGTPQTNSTTEVELVKVAVTPPAGLRPLRVDATWGRTQFVTDGDVRVAIQRKASGAADWTTLVGRHAFGEGGFLTAWDQFESEPGEVEYRLVFARLSGSVAVQMSVNAGMPLTIAVAEV
jgi:hypothetical protein